MPLDRRYEINRAAAEPELDKIATLGNISFSSRVSMRAVSIMFQAAILVI